MTTEIHSISLYILGGHFMFSNAKCQNGRPFWLILEPRKAVPHGVPNRTHYSDGTYCHYP